MSSQPPSLPSPATIRAGAALGVARLAVDRRRRAVCLARGVRDATSASAVIVASTSSRAARPFRSRWARREQDARAQPRAARRRAARRPASAPSISSRANGRAVARFAAPSASAGTGRERGGRRSGRAGGCVRGPRGRATRRAMRALSARFRRAGAVQYRENPAFPARGPASRPSPRFCARLLVGAGLFLVIVFAACVLWLRYVALPHVETLASARSSPRSRRPRAWRWTCAASTAAGRACARASSMEGFELSDRKGRAVLALRARRGHALVVGAAPGRGALPRRRPRPPRAGAAPRRRRPHLPRRQAAQRRRGPATASSPRWLLEQPRLRIHDATLVWRDEKAGAPEVRLVGRRDRDAAQARRRHLAALTATPPAHLAGRHRPARRRRRSSATASAGARAGERLRRGAQRRPRAAARAPAGARDAAQRRGQPARVGRVRPRRRARDHRRPEPARRAGAARRRRRCRSSSRASPGARRYRVEPDGFSFGTEGLRFRTRARAWRRKPGSFSIARRATQGAAPRGEVRADGIDLKIAADAARLLPGAARREGPGAALRAARRHHQGGAHLDRRGPREGHHARGARQLRGPRGERGRRLSRASRASPAALEGTEKGGTLRARLARARRSSSSALFRAPLALRHARRAGALEARRRGARGGDRGGALRQRRRRGRGHRHCGARCPRRRHATPGLRSTSRARSRARTRARVANYLPNRFEVTRDWLDARDPRGRRLARALRGEGRPLALPVRRRARRGASCVEGDVRDARLKLPPGVALDRRDRRARCASRARRMEIRADARRDLLQPRDATPPP